MDIVSKSSAAGEDRALIQAHLRELLASDLFTGSPKLSRFLEFTVERTLAGEGDALKEYHLGVTVYGRPPDYDPRVDPIVRVEARRLRAKLKQFYAASGDRPVRIEYATGSYAPVFRRQDQETPAPVAAVKRSAAIRRLALPVGIAATLLSIAALVIMLRPGSRSSPEPVITKLTADPGLSAWPGLSLDGQQVAYASDRSGEGGLDVWVQRLPDGEPVRLTHQPGSRTEPAFSADGRTIAYRSEYNGGSIFSVSSQGGIENLVVSGGRRPRYSPDGKWLAYWIARQDTPSRRDELYIKPTAGGPATRVAPEFTGASLPNWSSDSKRLLFRGTSGSPETLNWWVVDLEGGRPVATYAIDVLIQHHMIQAVAWDFRPFSWVKDRVTFSARLGEVTNIWQLHLSTATYKATGAAERLTSGTNFDAFPSMVETQNGKPILAFADTLAAINVWRLPIDPNSGKAIGEPEQVTDEAATWIHYPTVSADGTKLVHLRVRSKETAHMYFRDLKSGYLAKIYPNPFPYPHAKISSDGSRVAYRNAEDGKDAIYMFDTAGQQGNIHAHRACADCGRPMDWSRDNHKVLFATSTAPSTIGLLEVDSGKKVALFRDPEYDLEAARFSPSNEWIALSARNQSGGGRILIARPDAGIVQSSSSMIAISGGSEKDIIPAWSHDGNLLYLLSERDGHWCIWAQRLDKTKKRPLGPAFAIRHFHQFRGHMAAPPPEAVGLSVAGDRLFFSLFDMTGNIWIAKWQ